LEKSKTNFFVAHKLNLPGYSLIQETEGTGTLIITVDSSASISKRNLKQFSSIIENSMIHFQNIHLIVHDVTIHQRKIFDKDRISDFYNFISIEGYSGRGGTSHRYVFEEIQKKYWEKIKMI